MGRWRCPPENHHQYFRRGLDYNDTYIQSWNLSVQRDLPGRLVGEEVYSGVEDYQHGRSTSAEPGAARSALTAEQRLPITNAGNFIFDQPIGNASYEALQLRLTRLSSAAFPPICFTPIPRRSTTPFWPRISTIRARKGLCLRPTSPGAGAELGAGFAGGCNKGFLSHPVWAAKALKD
jgi:hypothetical protein